MKKVLNKDQAKHSRGKCLAPCSIWTPSEAALYQPLDWFLDGFLPLLSSAWTQLLFKSTLMLQWWSLTAGRGRIRQKFDTYKGLNQPFFVVFFCWKRVQAGTLCLIIHLFAQIQNMDLAVSFGLKYYYSVLFCFCLLMASKLLGTLGIIGGEKLQKITQTCFIFKFSLRSRLQSKTYLTYLEFFKVLKQNV